MARGGVRGGMDRTTGGTGVNVRVELADGLSLEMVPAGRGDDAAGADGFPSARLQRGLLLRDGPADLAEEGVGFGVPVLKCGAHTVFPGGADLEVREDGPLCTIRAVYRMDLVERLAGARGGTLRSRPLYAAKDALAALHRRLPAARRVLTAASSALRRRFRWRTVYVPVGLCAVIPVTVSVDRRDGSLVVSAALGGLPAGATEVALMNEQGARTFTRYEDEAGAVLLGGAIGTWEEVTAPVARFVSTARRVSFAAERVDGTTLYRGRELVGTRLAWAGLGLLVPAARRDVSYTVRVSRTA